MPHLRDRLTVVLVEPQYEGNVGFAARAMLNFGVDRLVLVNPVRIGKEGRDRAVHAQRVLDAANVVATAAEAYADFDVVVAFSARVSGADRSHLRVPISLRDAAALLAGMDGRIALVFGREDDGLRNEEVEPADLVVQIPTHPGYSSMNLSHAVSVALYEMAMVPEVVAPTVPASHREKEILFAHFRALLVATRTREHRLDIVETMFRRVIGRSGLSRWEYHRMMGVVSATLKTLGKWPVTGLDLPEEGAGEGEGEERAPPSP